MKNKEHQLQENGESSLWRFAKQWIETGREQVERARIANALNEWKNMEINYFEFVKLLKDSIIARVPLQVFANDKHKNKNSYIYTHLQKVGRIEFPTYNEFLQMPINSISDWIKNGMIRLSICPYCDYAAPYFATTPFMRVDRHIEDKHMTPIVKKNMERAKMGLKKLRDW